MKELDVLGEVRPCLGLPWIRNGETPCFVDELGSTWTPIGHNEGITWPNFAPLLANAEVAEVQQHLEYLASNGVTCETESGCSRGSIRVHSEGAGVCVTVEAFRRDLAMSVVSL